MNWQYFDMVRQLYLLAEYNAVPDNIWDRSQLYGIVDPFYDLDHEAKIAADLCSGHYTLEGNNTPIAPFNARLELERIPDSGYCKAILLSQNNPASRSAEGTRSGEKWLGTGFFPKTTHLRPLPEIDYLNQTARDLIVGIKNFLTIEPALLHLPGFFEHKTQKSHGTLRLATTDHQIRLRRLERVA